jgi:hypothetical protein
VSIERDVPRIATAVSAALRVETATGWMLAVYGVATTLAVMVGMATVARLWLGG